MKSLFDFREHVHSLRQLLLWTLLVIPVGILSGSASALSLWSLDRVTELHWSHTWRRALAHGSTDSREHARDRTGSARIRSVSQTKFAQPFGADRQNNRLLAMGRKWSAKAMPGRRPLRGAETKPRPA